MPLSYEIRLATERDLEGVARVHKMAFEGQFLSELGIRFLRAYYGQILDYEGGFILVADADKAIVGYVAGFVKAPEYYARLRQQKLRLGMAIMPALLRRPRVIRRILASLRHTADAAPEDTAEACELSPIAVTATCSGHGVGQELTRQFLEQARARDASFVYLTTEADDNERVNRFYQKLGFTLYRTYATPAGMTMNEYRYSWDDRA